MEKVRFINPVRERRRIDILEVLVDRITLEEAVNLIEEWVAHKRLNPALPGRRVVTANPEYVMAARKDAEFHQIVNSAAMVTPDGVGLILAGRLFQTPFKGRVTGVELTHALAASSARTGTSLFLLGAAPGVAEKAADELRRLYPGVVIAGCFSGQAGPEGDAQTVQQVQQAQADIVLVAYGMGKQDRWAVRNLDRCGAAVTIGVGGTFDYLSGLAPVPPKVIRRFGMEWAYRLYTQPWRWRRDIAMLQFGWRSVQQSVFELQFISRKQQVMVQYEALPELRAPELSQAQTA